MHASVSRSDTPSSPASVGDLLVQEGKLSQRDLDRAAAAHKELGVPLQAALVQLGLVTDIDVARAVAKHLGVAFLTLDDFPAVPPEVPGLLPDFQRAHRVYPVRLDGDMLTVALADPTDSFVLKALSLTTGLNIQPCVALESDLDAALHASAQESAEMDSGDAADTDSGDFVEHLRDLASEAPVIRLVNQIISRVIELRASDIHLEPFDDGLHVRYRVDGEIATAEVVSPNLSAAVNSRVKLMAHLDIAERRLPQDGRIKMRVKGRELDLRVSTVPTVHGESVVMRVLDRTSVRYSLEEMGFEPQTLARFNQMLQRPHGIVLVTGPTGSGKTTTLYAALSKIDSDAFKIITVEEPVEYQLEGINQIQVHQQIGLTFARALRSILRQDPDIIMIGEMRDGETAQIAVQSALTGHLVLSTLHTNTAAGAVTRLKDMGVEPYLITSSVNAVLSQRLVRCLCPHCKRAGAPSGAVLQRSGLSRLLDSGQPIYEAIGCDKCRGTGYLGRTGIHELLVLDDSLRRAVLDGADSSALHRLAMSCGMTSLQDDALRKVAAGVTTLDEVMRATEEQGDA